MFCRIHDTPIYLDEEKTLGIEHTVLDGKTRHDFARDVYGQDVAWIDVWQEVISRIHALTVDHLSRIADASWGKFLLAYHEFDYRQGQAQINALGVVHSYCLATSQAAIHPNAFGISTAIHNRMTMDSSFAHPIADRFILCFNQYPQSWLSRKLRGRFDASVHINCKDVLHIYGNLSSFEMLVRGAAISFGGGVSIDLSPEVGNADKTSLLTPDPPPVPAVMTAITSIRSLSLAHCQA
jgi:hypothetical protein